MVVRAATIDDAEAIAAVFGRAWWHGYEDFLPYDQLTRYDAADRLRMWTAMLEGQDTEVLVATTTDGVVRGFVAFGATRAADPTRDGELLALYVDPPAQGAGVGRLLHDAALAALQAAGHRYAAMWVMAENAHALVFAAGIGWVSGGEPRQDDDWPAPSVRLRMALQ